MADNTNEIITTVSVDTSEAVTSVGDLAKSVDGYKSSASDASDATEKFNFTNEEAIAISGRYAQSMKDLQTAVEQNAEAITVGMQSASSATQQFAAATQQNQQVFQNANTSLLGSLSQQRIAFQDVGRAITGQGFSLRALSSNFALLGPQVVIAAAAVGFLYEQFEKYIDTIVTASSATKEINDTISKSLSQDLGQVQLLTATIQDSNTSTKERKEAIDELIKQHPNYFKNLQEEDGVTKNLTTDTEKFTKAIEEEARIKAVSAKITELMGKELEVQAQATQDLAAYESALDGVRTGKTRGSESSLKQSIAAVTEQRDKDIASIQKQIDIYKNLGVASEQSLSSLGGTTGVPKKDPQANKHAQDLIELKAYEDSIAQVTSDARTKELAGAQKQYDELSAKFKGFTDLETKLAEDYRVKVAAINAKYDASDAAAITKALENEAKQQAKYLQDEGKVVDEYENKRKTDDQESRQTDLALEQASYQKALGAAMTLGQDLTSIEDANRRAIAQINTDWDKKDLQQAESNTKKQLEVIRELYRTGDRETAVQRDQNRIAELAAIKKVLQAELAAAQGNEAQVKLITGELSAIDKQSTEATQQLSKDRIEQRDQELTAYGSVLNSAASLLGKSSAEGKALAVAGTLISTYASAQKAYESQAAIPVIGPELGIAAAAAAIAAGLANVKQILSVQTPGGSGSSSGSSTPSMSSPGGGSYGAPSIPNTANTTTLSSQSINAINDQINNNPTKIYVLEADISASQQRVLGYQNASVL